MKSATVEDNDKLNRVLGYLKGTANCTLLLRSHKEPVIRAYVDAAYALHTDFKSHTGVVIYVGETLSRIIQKTEMYE